MANIVNFSTYGFLDDILALNEDNWRNFFKPIVYDSVQGGLEVTAGTGMTVNVSAGECRCGSIMGISNSQMSLDINVGDNTYSRIDSVVIQYTYGDPSLLSVAVLQGEPSASPVAPTLTKSYNSLWQMEIAQILVPPNVTTTAECTITDKRVIYSSLDSIIDPINENIDDINDEIENINSNIEDITEDIQTINGDIDDINQDIDDIEKNKLDNGAVAPVFSEASTYAVGDVVSYQGKIYKFKSSHSVGVWNSSEVDEITTWYEKADNGAVAPVFSEIATYAVDACVMYQGKLYKFLSAHSPGPWVGGNEVVETNALAQSGGGGGSGGVGDEITFNDSNSAMIITSSNRSINSLESAIAIISSGDTHPAINAGQYVYVKLHSNISGIADLPEGLYIAKSSISANVALTTSNVSSVSGGGLNNLLINIPNYYNNAGFHNSIFRGNSLGSSISSTQWSEISAGTFKDLFIGDYWTINNINWRIAAFDYWLRCGDTECTTHHIVIVPDSNLLTADGSTTHFMDTANVTSGGYLGSGFRSGTNHDSGSTANTSRQQCINIVNSAFGSSHILTHREYFTNAVTNGKPSAGAWVDSTVDMMNERMVYGNAPFSPVSDGTTVPTNYTIDKGQLPLFALAPQYICNRAHWWLRDPVSSANFAVVNYVGACYCDGASAAWVGVRPAFGIK